ncbi:hypothetical protein GOODEAATRI_003327 [Goodea atripinnis]|uniref:Uncharacterized protein n=1 Tax=Goodea atripinnis TaxID=208336 RepID=A0ABV0NRI1_9TELE
MAARSLLFGAVSRSEEAPLAASSLPTGRDEPACQVSDGDERVERGGWQLRGLPASLLGGQSPALLSRHAGLQASTSHQTHRMELQVRGDRSTNISP